MTALATYRNAAIITAVVVLAFYPTLTDLMATWLKFDESQSHGLVVIALFAHLFTKQLRQLPPASQSPNWLGVVALTASSVAWCLAATLNIEAIEQVLLLPILFFLCWALLGFRSAMALAPSISLLLFAIPVWDYLTPALIDTSSEVVMQLIRLSNITALIDGNSIYLPHGRIDIADGCSGLRYFTIALALAYYLILTSETNWLTKAKLLGTAIALGLLTNWLRIYIIIMVAHFTDMQSSLVKDHEMFGWFLFFIVCLPLVYFSRTLPLRQQAPAAVATNTDTNTDTTADTNASNAATTHTSPQAALTIVLSIVAMTCGPALYRLMNTNVTTPVIGDWQQLGYQQLTTPGDGPFQLPQARLNLHKTNTSSTSKTSIRGIRNSNTGSANTGNANTNNASNSTLNGMATRIEQDIAIHWQQNKDSDLVPYIANSLNREQWTRLQTSTLQMPNQHALQLNLYSKKGTATQFSCSVSWYRVGGIVSTNYYIAKLLQIPALLSQKKLFAAAVITAPANTPSCEQLQQPLIDAASATHKDLLRLITPGAS